MGRIRPTKRPLVPRILTFFFTFQPISFAFMGGIKEQPLKASTRKSRSTSSTVSSPISSPLPAPPPPSPEIENIFIEALARASLCKYHTRLYLARNIISNRTFSYHKPRRRYTHTGGSQVRLMHSLIIPDLPTAQKPRPRAELLQLLDYYQEPFSTQVLWPPSEPPASTTAHDAEVSRDNLLADSSDGSAASSIDLLPSDSKKEKDHGLPALEELIRILRSNDCSHEQAFDAYSNLPSPGVSYLSRENIRLLLRRLSVIEKKSEASMLRYLSVTDDMKACNLPMKEAEWNSAIAFCGRCFPRISAADVKAALLVWKEMEEEAGVKSGNVTFNILFDIASKAGKFVLAEMILSEMEKRKLSVNRYARTGFIYYHGLKGDGDGVRKAYREFVEAGEVVDTVVINCVIASLLRAGEPAAAEQVYVRIKRLLSKELPNLPQIITLNWKQTRDLGRILDRAARRSKVNPQELQRLRDEQEPLTPNLQTFAIFIEHHVSDTGELRRITPFLTDMQALGIPMHGRIFLKLFKGFAYHGGIRYSTWTKARLESVWKSLLLVLDEESDVKIMKWMVIWTVRAFERCAGRERTLEVWGELRKRWKAERGEVEVVVQILRDVLKVEGNF